MNFSWAENEILSEKITLLTGARGRVKQSNQHPVIYFSYPETQTFLEFLGQSPVECYNYKFVMPEREKYNAYQRKRRKEKQLNSMS